MHLLIEFVLLAVGIACVQGGLVVPQINNLNAIISSSQVKQFLSPDKLQQLQNRIAAIAISGFANRWNVATFAQVLQQLVTQYIPQVTQMRIEYDNNRNKSKIYSIFHFSWKAIGQSVLNNVAPAFSSIRTDIKGGLFKKRDLEGNDLQFLAQLPLDKLAQIVEAATIPDRPTALAKLRELLRQFFSVGQGRIDFDELAENMLTYVNTMLPQLCQPNSSIPH